VICGSAANASAAVRSATIASRYLFMSPHPRDWMVEHKLLP
jgi:hypothetical protein